MTIKWIGLSDRLLENDGIQKLNYMARNIGIELSWLPLNEKVYEVLDYKTRTVLFVAASLNNSSFKLVKEISLRYPFVAVIIVTNNANYDLKEILRSGAVDIINLAFDEDEIVEAIQEAERNLNIKWELEHSIVGTSKNGKVITVCSMKGGVGKTTISVNLAAAIAKHNLGVVVIDMDFQSGDVAILFDIKPKITIYDWIKANSDAQENIEHYLLKHQSGVEILAAPVRLELAEEITSDHMKNLLSIVTKKYDLIIIDTPPQLFENELVILENADKILLVINNDLPTLKNSTILLDTLKNLGFQNKTKIILNRNTRSAGINKEHVTGIIGNLIYGNIPNEERLAIISANKGIPFTISHKRSKIANSIIALSDKLLEDLHIQNNDKIKKKSIFSTLRK